MRISRFVVAALTALTLARSAAAQQRPLITEDPQPVGPGQVLFEGGVDIAHNQTYPVSGLEGNLWRAPVVGISIGISPIAEFQIDGGFFNRLAINKRKVAPLSDLVTATGNSTHDVEDVVVGTKIRIAGESGQRPAIALRFATRLPNAQNESGLGLDTIDWYSTLLAAKTVQSIRVVANVGVGILSDPTEGHRQNDVLTYGLSFARALTEQTEVVGEINGRASTRSGEPFPGTESRGLLNLGARYTRGPIRFDGGAFLGLTSVDPTIGVSVGLTYVIHAFNLP